MTNRRTRTALCLVAITALTMVLAMSAMAQSSVDPYTVGLWHLDEIVPSGYQEITPDAVGVNDGTIGSGSSAMLVEGKFDNALSFNGHNFVYVPISFLVGFPPSPQPIYIPLSHNLNVQEEIKIEAWINVQGYTDAAYNNIVVKCTRDDPNWESTRRLVGLAIRAGSDEDGEVSKGVLSGFVTTDSGGFNEIVTTQTVIPLNQWVHVAFERTTTGMHLYVNGYEQTVKAIHGVQNPQGMISNGTEVYFGHDAKVTVDEVKISNLKPDVETAEASIDIGPNLMMAVITVSAIFAVAWLLRRALQLIVFRSKP